MRYLTNLLAQVRVLNFYGNTRMERVMEQSPGIVEQFSKERQHSSSEIQ